LRKAFHNWVKKFSQGRSKVTDDAQPGAEVAEMTVKRLLCFRFLLTGKAMGQVYQCWWRICWGKNVFFSRFEYHVLHFISIFDLFTDSRCTTVVSLLNWPIKILTSNSINFLAYFPFLRQNVGRDQHAICMCAHWLKNAMTFKATLTYFPSLYFLQSVITWRMHTTNTTQQSPQMMYGKRASKSTQHLLR
jgi:hypothetical protein